MDRITNSASLPASVPLVEQLRSIPRDAVLRIDTPNVPGCMDTRSIPVGRLCHEAAASLHVQEHAQEGEKKLWLWRNFVDGRPEYWAFDNPYPVHMDCGDPQTLGEPCGYAIFKPSRVGRAGVSEAEVLRRIALSAPVPADGGQEWVAQVVSSGPHDFPLLQWRTAEHSFNTPIGTKLYAAPLPVADCGVEAGERARQAMQVALDALAQAGLEWYRDACPHDVNGSDEEADEVIGNAMQALRDELAAPKDSGAPHEEGGVVTGGEGQQ